MARWAHAMGVLSGLLFVGGTVVVACLPDLPNTCGNGHIDPNETCDPGPKANPGCSANCEIVCTPPDGGASFIDDPASDHCYFTSRATTTYDNGNTACAAVNAHPVTFVDDREVSAVVANLHPDWLPDGFWVGMERLDAGGPFTALALNEPGWDVLQNCSGCFMHGIVDGGLPVEDAGGPPECVITQVGETLMGSSMAVMGRYTPAQVVCEREAPGARSVACYGSSFCFTVLASNPPKTYVYNPAPMTATAAELFCQHLNDGGASSFLGVFESRAEREQVIYEIGQLQALPGGAAAPPIQGFWIGLHSVSRPGKPGLTWVWDDGVIASPTSSGPRPSVWGGGQPAEKGTAYIYLGGTYDTGLARVEQEAPGLLFPVVCQLGQN